MVEQSQAEALAAAAAAGDNLICQAIINSGIALAPGEAVVEETSPTPEEIDKVVSDCPDADEDENDDDDDDDNDDDDDDGVTEIQVKEEFVEMETEVTTSALVRLPHCSLLKPVFCHSDSF